MAYNTDNLVELNSVGSLIDVKNGMVYPAYENGKPALQYGTHLEDVGEEWFKALKAEDKIVVKNVVNIMLGVS